MQDQIRNIIKDSITTKERVITSLLPEIERTGQLMIEALQSGKKLLICGNGGSAADAQHFATELTVRFEKDRKPLPAIALTTDTSHLTACANDCGYDQVFSRQVEALGNPEDILIGITTSGNSENVLKAIEAAKKKGLRTICLNGKDGGKVTQDNAPDANIIIPSKNTARIQESHIMLIHIWSKLIEDALTDAR